MASRSTLQLYSAIILPRLADGPRTLHELDVPRYAALHLKAHGLITCRMKKVRDREGRCLGAVEQYMLPEQVPSPLMDCATLDFAAMGIDQRLYVD
jgi:hypothetical protein